MGQVSTFLGEFLGFALDFHVEASLDGIVYSNIILPLRSKLGFCAPYINFPPGLKAEDILNFYQRMHCLCHLSFFPANLPSKTYELFRWTETTLKVESSDRWHNPDIVILDEPEASLEESAIVGIAEAITALNNNQKTYLVATHDATILESCTRVLCMAQGQIIQYDYLAKVISALLGNLSLEISYENTAERESISTALEMTKCYLLKVTLR